MDNATIQTLLTVITFYLVWKSTRHIALMQYTRSIIDAWNTVNMLPLQHPELIPIAKDFQNPYPNNDSLEKQRKRWFTFIYINALYTSFMGIENGIADRAYATQGLHDLLHPLLDDDDAFRLTQNRGYHPKFARYCAKQRQQRQQQKKDLLHNLILRNDD
jgi:hypothetical protein